MVTSIVCVTLAVVAVVGGGECTTSSSILIVVSAYALEDKHRLGGASDTFGQATFGSADR